MTHTLEARLSELPAAAAAAVIDCARSVTLRRGEMLHEAGRTPREIWFVESGYLRSFIVRDGEEINVAFTFEGEFTTDLAAMRSGAASDRTIVAAEPAVVRALARERLIELYASHPPVEGFGRSVLEELLEQQEAHANLFRLGTPAERYHHLVATAPHMLERVSLSQLASWLGVARETLSRIRRER